MKIIAGIISPELADRVRLYDGSEDIFEHYRVEARVEKLLARKVWLKNGAYIVIDQTEALTAIDVNTGKYIGSDNLQQTLFETNCEAAREIARQLRLRDISGIIIIDFIDMESSGKQKRPGGAFARMPEKRPHKVEQFGHDRPRPGGNDAEEAEKSPFGNASVALPLLPRGRKGAFGGKRGAEDPAFPAARIQEHQHRELYRRDAP